MQRLLAMVPWIAAHDGPTLAEVCERFGLTEKELAADLEVMWLVGLPPYTPDALIDVVQEGDRVWIHFADVFDAPQRLTPDQAVALLTAGASVLALPGTEADGPLGRGVAKLAAVLGVDADQVLDVDLGLGGADVLEVLRTAVAEHRRVHLDYYSYGRDARTERDVDPYLVHAEDGSLYVLGHCHLAGGRAPLPGRPHRGAPRSSTSGSSRRPPTAPAGVFQPDDDDPRVELELDPRRRGWPRRTRSKRSRPVPTARCASAWPWPPRRGSSGCWSGSARRPGGRRTGVAGGRRASAPARASSTATVDPAVTDSDHSAHEDELRAELHATLERTAASTSVPDGADLRRRRRPDVVDAVPPRRRRGPPRTPVPATTGHRRLQSGLEWVAVVVGALVVALVVKTFLFQAFYIPSASMEPTLEKGDRVLVNKVSYDLHDVNRGDVIVFELDEEDVGPDGIKDLIKRVIGLPGDVIESRDGVVYVNDRALDEPYLAEGTVTGDPEDSRNPPIERQTVPEGHVFVLGDNRSNSADSRYPYRGPIPIDSIVGRAFVLVWPPGDIGTL